MQVLTSLSGLPISAASAGFAPTNSADVSAIASAYQVVSSTATQLYAGTAYVTSVNGAPLSASRAGNAANASLANSAWYDGTGRLISALPDSAAVSAIASSYAESAASGKQDTLTFSYDDDKISAINGSALAGQGGAQVVTSLQYKVDDGTAEASVIGKSLSHNGSVMSSRTLDVLSEYGDPLGDELSSISSLEVGITGADLSYFQELSASVSAIMLKPSALSKDYWALTNADYQSLGLLTYAIGGYDSYIGNYTAKIEFITSGFSAGEWLDNHIPFRTQNPSIFFASSLPYGVVGMQSASGSGIYVDPYGKGFSAVSGVNELPLYVQDDTGVSAIASAYAQSAVSSVSGNYYPRYTNPSGYARSSDVVMRSSVGSSDKFITSVNAVPLMAADSAITTSVSDTASVADGSYQTAFVDFGDGAVSRSVIVILNSNATTRITAMDSNGYNVEYGYINLSLDTSNYTYTGQYVLTSTAAVSAGIFVGYQGISASSICGYTVPLAHASALPTYSYDAEDKISAINGSAIAGGAGGVDSATVSAIASSYAESAASGKLDSTAFNSADFYSTSNPSGFITGVDLSPYQTTADMSSYIPTSLSSDFQQATGMSSYVPYSSIGYNTASAISGINGSALAGTTYSAGTGIDITDDVISVEAPVDIVAGPGIVIDNPDGNTLRVSVDQAIETVLWDNYTFANNKAESVAMTETPFNFSQIRITFYIDSTSESWGTLQTQIIDMVALASSTNKYFTLNGTVVNGNDLIVRGSRCKFNGTEIEEHSTIQWYTGGIGPMTQALHIYRIVGVGRTASN